MTELFEAQEIENEMIATDYHCTNPHCQTQVRVEFRAGQQIQKFRTRFCPDCGYELDFD